MLLVTLLALAAQSAPATAQVPAPGAAEDEGTRVEIATSPQFLLLEGYHASLAFRPAGLPVRLNALSFALQIPTFGLGENTGKGWSHRHRAPLVVGADVFPLPWDHADGVFAGALVAPHFNEYAHGDDSYSQLEVYLMARAGYQLFPGRFFGFGENGVYVQAWVGAGIPVDRNDDIVVDGERWQPRPISVVPVIEVGWRF